MPKDTKVLSRVEVLEKVDDEFEGTEKRREPPSSLREDRWMLPAVEARIQVEQKKEKVKKKKKKHKKHKKKKKLESSTSSDSCSEEEFQWVEKTAATDEVEPDVVTKTAGASSSCQNPGIGSSQLRREEWMSMPTLFPSATNIHIQEKEKKMEAEEENVKNLQKLMMDKPGQHTRELNPYWKGGGTGLPEECPRTTSSVPHPNKVGDGGSSWLRRAYQRAVEQAKEEGRTLEEVAAERWGSLDKLQKLLSASEEWCVKREQNLREDKKPHGRHAEDCAQIDRKKGRDGRWLDVSKYKERGQVHHKHFRKTDGKEDYRKLSGSPSGRGSGERHHKLASTACGERLLHKSESSGRCAFQKPSTDGSANVDDTRQSGNTSGKSGWRKQEYKDQNKQQREEEKQKDRKEEKKNREEFPKKGENTPTSSSDSGSEYGDRQDDTQEEAAPLLTDKEMNELGAKIVKMEILGNQEMASQLKKKLAAAKQAHEKRDSSGRQEQQPREEVVVLAKTSASGVVLPLQGPAQSHPSGGKKRRKEKVETHREGKRVRYFPDDDRFSLMQMFEREKLTSAADQNSMLASLAGRSLEKTDADYDVDDVFVTRASRKESEAQEQQRARERAVHEHRQTRAALDGCHWCLDSKHMLKHLIIAIGVKTYLCVPPYQSLTEGHCIIVPLPHTPCATQLDEDVWDEVKVFQKGLTRMFEEQEKDAVFFETAMSLRKFPHMVLECVPVPRAAGDTLSIYFKKAILECESEWSLNKKVVDLKNQDIRRTIPKGLPYFAVGFGLSGGFAHVIEDEKMFPRNFAQEIIGGILDLEPQMWKKHKKEMFDAQRKKVLKFAEWWKPYDWTHKLAGKQ